MTTLNRPDETVVVGQPPPVLRMTEEQFVAWCDEDTRAEWVDGEVIVMAPIGDAHARMNIWLTRLVAEFVEYHDLGQVRGPETQIRIGPKRQRREPDLLYVSKAREHIIRPNHVEGAPDLVVEIVSPESLTRDWRDKYEAYEAAGIKEYWVIDPGRRMDVYRLSNDRYQLVAEQDGKVVSPVLPGFYLRSEWLWQDPLPKVPALLRELGVRI